jgi:hypothetical protein
MGRVKEIGGSLAFLGAILAAMGIAGWIEAGM